MTREQIVSMYRQIDSIKAISRETGLSEQTVRRILIEAGEYTTERSREIGRLFEQGKSATEIAETMGIRKNTVFLYLPCSRNSYATGEKTKNANNIKRWRAKKGRG